MIPEGRHVRRVRGAALGRSVWPPARGDHGLADHQLLAGPDALDARAYAEAIEEFAGLIEAVDAAEPVDRRRWLAALARLGVHAVRESEPHPSLLLGEVMSTIELAAIALDFVPEMADDAPHAVLGPFTSALDARRTSHRRALRAAIAAAAFAAAPGAERSALRAWSREKPRPTDVDRDRLLAVTRTPFAPWRLVEARGPDWSIAPLSPLPRGWVPDQPVRLEEVGAVDGEPAPGALLFARVVRLSAGWQVVTPLLLPEVPPAALLTGWLARAFDPDRVENRALTLLDGLRRHGHRVCAEAHRWWWCEGATR